MRTSIPILLISTLSFVSFAARAQTAAELSCKAQAKEIAVQTYSSCMTEARNSQIDQIRKSYKEDLTALKTKYDRELKKMSLKQARRAKGPSSQAGRANGTPSAASRNTGTNGLTKTADNSHLAAPKEPVSVSTEVESPQVIPVRNSGNSLEKEANQADSNDIEVIDMALPGDVPAT